METDSWIAASVAGNAETRDGKRVNSFRTQESGRVQPSGGHTRDVAVVGYASVLEREDGAGHELGRQADVIAEECDRRGLHLIELIHERGPATGTAVSRPGLAYAFERISSGAAGGVVVAELSRITRSAAELGKLLEWLGRSEARLVAAAQALDTNAAEGRLAADVLVEISGWESARLSERTRTGLEAARRNGRTTGRPAVVDNPALRERIAQLRAAGMTLQAIADRLNAEGVPTVRGGSKWRHSSVQAAAGYRRPARSAPAALGGRTGRTQRVARERTDPARPDATAG